MSSRRTVHRKRGNDATLSSRWHALHSEKRLAMLACSCLMLLGVLHALSLVGAAGTVVMFEVTNGSSNSSSSSSSSYSASSETGGSAGSAGADSPRSSLPSGNRDVSHIIGAMESEDLPDIVAERNIHPEKPVTSGHAAAISYDDVPTGIWYESAVNAFLSRGILDAKKKSFFGGTAATRAEFAKLLGKLDGEVPPLPPARLTFDDTPWDSWFTPFLELAAAKGWMRGYRDCAGTHPCFTRPASTITRAEAVAMTVRFFGLQSTTKAPRFTDLGDGAWYTDAMATSADLCIVQPLDTKYRGDPDGLLTRAQMMVILDRGQRRLSYGKDCLWPGDSLPSSSSAMSDVSSSSNVPNQSSSSSTASDMPAAALLENSNTDKPAAPASSSPLTVATALSIGIIGAAVTGRFLIKAAMAY